jgi:hypothetical protein
MVDHKNAFDIERKLFALLKNHPKCKKYMLSLHEDDIYGIDIIATAKNYEGFAIEVESTQHNSKWPTSEPYPPSWNWFSVPRRKQKFFVTHPMSIFVKVNADVTRAVIAPMSYICSADFEEYANENSHQMKRNDFFKLYDPEHPAVCYCPVEDIPEVVDAQFKAMHQMKKVNKKYTDKRPEFHNGFTNRKKKEH